MHKPEGTCKPGHVDQLCSAANPEEMGHSAAGGLGSDLQKDLLRVLLFGTAKDGQISLFHEICTW